MLSKTAEYALRAVVWLARAPGRAESSEHLAEATKVPRRYLHKVLQDLVHAEIVRSQSGPGGGYALNKPPNELSILDVVNAVAPLERIHTCPLGISEHTSLCPLHRELDQAYEATERAFASVTLEKLTTSTDAMYPLCGVP